MDPATDAIDNQGQAPSGRVLGSFGLTTSRFQQVPWLMVRFLGCWGPKVCEILHWYLAQSSKSTLLFRDYKSNCNCYNHEPTSPWGDNTKGKRFTKKKANPMLRRKSRSRDVKHNKWLSRRGHLCTVTRTLTNITGGYIATNRQRQLKGTEHEYQKEIELSKWRAG